MFTLHELIFCIVCGLYQLNNLPKLLYAVYLSVFISLCYGIFDFRKYQKQMRKLSEAYYNLENITQLLPQALTIKEEHYQNIISNLYNHQQELIFNSELKESEMKDYYTLWAHQIKTPIAAIKLLLQNEDQNDNSFTLLKELFKIEQYVEMVLHYLRLESISSDMLLKPYPLKNIVNQAVKKYGVLFISSKLNFNLEDFNCTVITDEKWVEFVLEQLISNALKYTTSGSISIYMDKSSEKALVIEDTGIGIRQEDLPRIFDRGFTGYNGRFDKKSTGIGLYLCKQILNKLSHTITFTSEPGKGTKVSINFQQDIIS
jgi:signal transduction histidine kinase